MANETIISNHQDQVLIHFSVSGDVTVLGNNTVSNLTSNSVEIVLDTKIYQVWWGTDTSWLVETGNSTANSVWGFFTGTGYAGYGVAGEALPLLDSGEELFCTLEGGNGTIIIDLRKESSF